MGGGAVLTQVGEQPAAGEEADDGLGAGGGGAGEGEVEAAFLEAQCGDAVDGVGAESFGGLSQQAECVVVAQEPMTGAFEVELLAHLGGGRHHRGVRKAAAVNAFDALADLAEAVLHPHDLADVGQEPDGQRAAAQGEGRPQFEQPRAAVVAKGEFALEQIGGLAVGALPPQVGRGDLHRNGGFGLQCGEVGRGEARSEADVDAGRREVGGAGGGGLLAQQRGEDVAVDREAGVGAAAQDRAAGGKTELPDLAAGRRRLHLGEHPARRAADGGELGDQLAQAVAGDHQHAGQIAFAVVGGAAVAEGQVLGVRILEQAVFQRVGQQARQIAAGATGQRHFEPQALGAGKDDFAFGGGGPVAGLGMAFGDGLAVVAEQHPRAVGPGGPLFVDGEEEAGAHSGFTAVFARRWWASSGCGRAALPCAPWRRRSGRGRWPGSGGW